MMWVRHLFAVSVTLALGCASAPRSRERVGIPLDELLAGSPLSNAQNHALVADAEVLALNVEIGVFLARHVAREADRASRLRQLTSAIIRGSNFKLEYDESTRTAAGTFEARRGNCLSFSNMFVAMAREVGLQASFQEVDTPPDWSFRDDAFILNRHVNVVVEVGRSASRLGSLIPRGSEEHVIDFNVDDYRSSYDRRRISDARARAHYFNNVAVERMQAGDVAAALAYFRKAIENDAAFSPAWTNLGILYLRAGHFAHAEEAYLEALRADPADLVAMSNLASLYARRGWSEWAAEYRERVVDHRNRNPYYRFMLGRQAFEAGDYDAAIGHLRYAVRKKRDEDRFCMLLGKSYLRKGDELKARRWLTRAQEVAATPELKRRYAREIETLLGGPPEPGGSR